MIEIEVMSNIKQISNLSLNEMISAALQLHSSSILNKYVNEIISQIIPVV